jgi:hypothetical protein
MSSLSGSMGMGQANKIPKGYRQGQIQQFTPDQLQLFKQMFSHVGPDSYLSRLAGGDEDIFNQIEAPALKQFSALQGNLASRFSGMGMGGRRSSGFQNSINQAGQDFASQLQSQRQGLQQQAIQDLMGLSNSLLSQRPYEQFLVEKQRKPSGWGSLAGALGGGALGLLAGGPIGALTGASIGHGIGSGMGSNTQFQGNGEDWQSNFINYMPGGV